MASINLARNARLWVSSVTTGHNNSNTFEITLQEDYSFSQSVTSTDISIEETGATPSRGSKRFNSSLDPVEWNFATYFSPYALQDGNGTLDKKFIFTADMLLWHAVASGDSTTIDLDDSNFDTGVANADNGAEVYGDDTKFNVSFANNSAHVLTKLYLYFLIDNDVYLINDVQVGQAEIGIDITDIAQVAWSGSGTTYERLLDGNAKLPSFIDLSGASPVVSAGASYDTTAPAAGYVAIPTNKKFLVNKFTTIDFQSDVSGSNKYYTMPITAATITINNNVSYLTPNTLSEVDVSIGSFTGAFEVTGSMDAYMRSTGNDGSTELLARGTTELLADMLSNPGAITNTTNVVFNIGGESGARAVISMPTTHIAVPTLGVDDVISTTIEFKAIPTSDELKSGDELTVAIYEA